MSAPTTRPPGAARLALAGLRRARGNQPLAATLWAAHLALAALVAAPFAAGLARIAADRPAAEALLGRPELDLFAQIVRAGGELFASFGPALATACALALLLNALLAGGVLEVLTTADDRTFFHRFARGAGHFAGRMLKLGALAAPCALLLAAAGAMPLLAASRRMAENDHEIAATWLRLGGLALAGLLLLVVLVGLDLARVRLVRDDRPKRTPRLFASSLGLVLRHPLRVLGTWALLAVAFLLLLGVYSLLATLTPTTTLPGILVVALLQQLLMLGRANLRVALWSAEIEIVRHLVPDGTGAVAEAPAPEPIEAQPAGRLAAVHPVLATSDVERSLAFYAQLGFHTLFRDDPDAPRYAAIAREDVELHLQWHDASDWPEARDRPTYRILVEDVDGLYADLEQSGVLPKDPPSSSPWARPADTPWATREFHLHDPDRNGLQFYRPR